MNLMTLSLIFGAVFFGGFAFLWYKLSRKGYRKSIKNRILRALMLWNGGVATLCVLILLR